MPLCNCICCAINSLGEEEEHVNKQNFFDTVGLGKFIRRSCKSFSNLKFRLSETVNYYFSTWGVATGNQSPMPSTTTTCSMPSFLNKRKELCVCAEEVLWYFQKMKMETMNWHNGTCDETTDFVFSPRDVNMFARVLLCSGNKFHSLAQSCWNRRSIIFLTISGCFLTFSVINNARIRIDLKLTWSLS